MVIILWSAKNHAKIILAVNVAVARNKWLF